MARDDRQSADEDRTLSEGTTAKKQKQDNADNESCRCEEVSKKSFPELLKMMLADLSFWKKKKKRM